MSEDNSDIFAQIQSYLWTLGIDTAICASAFLLNLLLIILIFRNPKKILKARNLIFLLNLAIADLSMSILYLEIIFSEFLPDSTFNLDRCVAHDVFTQIFSINAITSVMLLALDRYLIVVKKKPMNILVCFVSIFASWLLSILVGVAPLMVDRNAYIIDPNVGTCLLDFSNSSIYAASFSVTIIFLMEVLVTVVFYISIVLEIRATVKDISRVQSNPYEKGSKAINKNVVISQNQSSEEKTLSESKEHPKSPLGMIQTTIFSRLRTFSVGKGSTPSSVIQKPKKLSDLQLSRKTIILGCTHFFLFFPTVIGSFLDFANSPYSEMANLVFYHFFLILLIFDPLWSFLLDPQIKRFTSEIFSSPRNKNENIH
ncbi:hypothetical protein HMI54_002174 [Coelomomyces lativittatus]|nr:hypothetical protein HMI55_004654 [Coelomomyces lativittatus]KAJ1507177.1 hypothetical protein HMI56_000236 [Coelomomyces lativittatus]KAJ1509716.1 hypothetical protein HMI54_002174 [Coelomomyces lativittatus]